MSAPHRFPFLVALGSNLGSRRANLDAAVEALRARNDLAVAGVSSWWKTAPVGGPSGQRSYYNGVLRGVTSLDPEELLAVLLSIEAAHGRKRDVRNGPRTLDLDLLTYADERRHGVRLHLPHPRMEERLFVLDPLAELWPDFILPTSGRTVREACAQLRARLAKTSEELHGHHPTPA